MLRDGIIVEGVEIIDARDEGMEVGTDVIDSGEKSWGWKNYQFVE